MFSTANCGVVFVLEDPGPPRDLDVGAHAPPVYHYLFAVLLRKMHDAYQALEVRGEHRDDKATF